MRCIARQSNILSRGTLCFGHSAVNILKLGKKVTTMSAPMSVSHAPDKPVIFGIDLGTHRSRVVTVEKTEEGLFKPDIMKNIPSVVTFTNNDPSKCIVGSAAKGRIITSASNTFCDTKLLIGRDYEDPVVQEVAMNKVGYKIHKSFDSRPCVLSSNFNQIFVPTDLAALILLKLKEFAEDERKTPMKNVVITKPAYFTETQVQATREAAQMAGLNVLQIIDEPTAAIFASGENIIDKTYVVYDFGGTFKVSVVETRNHEIKVKSTVYDLFLGGDDFDNALMNYFVTRLKSLTGMDLTKNSVSMKWLKESAEGAKTDLCYRSEVDLKFYCFLVDGTLELKTVKLTRTKFEELVGEFISKTVPLCHEVLDKAKVSKSDIDEVLAIGGVSMIPKVKATVEEIFGKSPTDIINRRDLVCVGAALKGFTLASNICSDNSSLKVSPHLPKPVTETEKFNYCFSDDLDLEKDEIFADVAKGILQSGIAVIMTEEEVNSHIRKYRTSNNLMVEDNPDVNFITAYEILLKIRRSNPEKEMPDEVEAQIDYFRKGRDRVVIEELRRFHAFKR